ncbi:MAG: response regulator transcription factor [Chloroflexota bacterium]
MPNNRVAPVNRGVKGPLVLVVDDEAGIVDMIQLGLKYEGYRFAGAFSGPEALDATRRLQPDVVVLDVMLPGLDGRQVCRRLRAISEVPILMLTARDAVADRVAGLDAGADDYLVKPFAFEELMARLRALLRRRQTPPGTVLSGGGVTLDFRTREVSRDGREVRLTPTEFDLLATFLRHPRTVLSKEQLLEHVWGFDFGGDDNVVEVYVRYLRTKLGDPRLIQTVRGVGYAFRPTGDSP